MKVLLVTSDLTYLPENACDFLAEITANDKNYIHSILFLKVPKIRLLKTILFLYVVGCFTIATTLLKNLLMQPLDKCIKLARQKNLQIYRADSINDHKIISLLKQQNFDLIINYRTRCIYKKEALQIPKIACINIHHGILPDNRGVFCDLYALFENRPAGFTIHLMNEKVDDGDILSICEVDKGTARDYMQYLSKSTLQEAQELQKVLEYYRDHKKIIPVLKNISSRPRYTKNPNYKVIRSMLAKGLKL